MKPIVMSTTNSLSVIIFQHTIVATIDVQLKLNAYYLLLALRIYCLLAGAEVAAVGPGL